MSDQWNATGVSESIGSMGNLVTLVEESTFSISERNGDVVAGTAQGLFFRDSRVISRYEVRVNEDRLEGLGISSGAPFSATFVSRPLPRHGDTASTLLITRSRYLGDGMREDIEIQNFNHEATYCSLDIFLNADFANLFAVKEGRGGDPDGEVTYDTGSDEVVFSFRRGGFSRGVRVKFYPLPTQISNELYRFEVIVPPAGKWNLCLEIHPVMEGKDIPPRYLCGSPIEIATPSERLAAWRRNVPQIETGSESFSRIIARSVEDLGALRLFDPDFPDRAVVAAGAPWFMTVFGRDSLITAWMSLVFDPDLALGVVQTLARFQGREVNARTEEEPGRILHEMRFGEAPSLSLGGGSIYYGTVDATPLFVMLAGELFRWGIAKEAIEEIMPNVDRAIDWIERFGDKDQDGYVEYQRQTDRGLRNQGWKDSWDGIRYADGRVADPPIALCEVQAYVYGAYKARARIAKAFGDDDLWDLYRGKASALKERFNRDFWLEDRGWLAIGLDEGKQPIDSLTSNMGHCLWTGIVDEDKAGEVAKKLTSPEMTSGWGIRTLGSSMGGYNPLSYHCGSVWPHDTAIAAAGLMRYGFTEQSVSTIKSLMDAANHMGGRLPELYSGLSRSDLATPIPYPTSCAPQAWASASPLLCLRSLLGMEPLVPTGELWMHPVLMEGMGYLRVSGIPLAGTKITVETDGKETKVSGLPPGIKFRQGFRLLGQDPLA
ncbi:MAG: amylo-alpha-1,6-glucosidase [Actinobacteria bacterium]|jgi:glycogen debranching enzyme|nr:amylo-alpha-1,6-glucosidase [Actinomycetota bacterium]